MTNENLRIAWLELEWCVAELTLVRMLAIIPEDIDNAVAHSRHETNCMTRRTHVRRPSDGDPFARLDPLVLALDRDAFAPFEVLGDKAVEGTLSNDEAVGAPVCTYQLWQKLYRSDGPLLIRATLDELEIRPPSPRPAQKP